MLRQAYFAGQYLFLGLLVGLIESGRGIENPWLVVELGIIYLVTVTITIIALVFAVPAGRIMGTISKQIALYGFRHYLTLPESWHENKSSGEKLQRLQTARQGVFWFLETVLWHIVPLPAMMITVCVSVITLDAPWYFILLFFGMMASFIGMGVYTGGWLKQRFVFVNKSLEKLMGGVYEYVVSTATIRQFNLRKYVMNKGKRLESENLTDGVDIYRMVFYRWTVLDYVAISWILIIVGFAVHGAIEGSVSIAAFSTIAFLTLRAWGETEVFAIIYKDLVEHWESFKRLTEILNEVSAVQEKPNALKLTTPEGAISFDKIGFHYDENKRVIENLSLEIAPGEKIGLVGPSGAGKSTIVKLLMRFYDVESGAIKIGAQDIRDVTLHSLQDTIAVIPQDVVLFNHSLMENIRYGRLDASDEEVFEAARRAHADDFIDQLPDGYETFVGERGVKLSGGQRQRIAIARAILKDAPILLLDEATSALDSESEKFIQESLEDLMEGKTVIAIAHRLSTIAHLDRLVVMDQGRIIEHGTHDELLQKDSLYAKLWGMQSGGFLGE